MSVDMQPSAGEVTHWARVVPDRRAVSGFPSPISSRFMSAMSIQMAVITNRNQPLKEEAKMTPESDGNTVNLKHPHDKKATQKKDNKAKLSKLLAVRKVSDLDVKKWADEGDIPKLELLVLQGKSHLLEGRMGQSETTQSFLEKIPHMKEEIKRIHAHSISGDIEMLTNLAETKLLMSRNEFGVLPVHLAAKYGHLPLLVLILNICPAAVRGKDSLRRSPLHYAATCEDDAAREEIMNYLIENGADKEAKDKLGNTAEAYIGGKLVFVASPPNSTKSQKIRRNRWVDPSALSAVNRKDFQKLVDMILSGDGDLLENIYTEDGEVQEFLNNVPAFKTKINNIYEAVRIGSVKNLQLHLTRKKFALVKEKTTATNLLHKATSLGHENVARYLIKNFPETLLAMDAKGRTPLHYAALMEDNTPLYDFMLDHGADPSILDYSGHSAKDYLVGEAIPNTEQEEAKESKGSQTFSVEQTESSKNSWQEVIGRNQYADLENGLSFALKVIGREKPDEPIERLAQLLLSYEIRRTQHS